MLMTKPVKKVVDINTELIKRLKVGVEGHLSTFWKKTDYSAKKGFSFGYDFTVDSIKRIRREWEERDKELELKVKDVDFYGPVCR